MKEEQGPMTDYRTFTLQLYDGMAPPVESVEETTGQQLMFANLRRRVVIDKAKPLGWHVITSNIDPELDPQFRREWMADSKMPEDTRLNVKNLTGCGCASCMRVTEAPKGTGVI